MIPRDAVVWLVAGVGWGLAIACAGGLWFVVVIVRRRLRTIAVAPACAPRPPPAGLARPVVTLQHAPAPVVAPQALRLPAPAPVSTSAAVVPATVSRPVLARPAPAAPSGVPLAKLLPPPVEPLGRRRRGMRWWPQDLPGWTPPPVMPPQLAPASGSAAVAQRGAALAQLPMIQVHPDRLADVIELSPANIVSEALPLQKSRDHWAWLKEL